MGCNPGRGRTESNYIIGFVRLKMSSPCCGTVYRERKPSQGQALRAVKPALTRFSFPDLEAATREMTHLKLPEEEKVLGGDQPGAAPGNKRCCRPGDGAGSKQKCSPIVRYERIRHLVFPIIESLNRHG